MSPNKRRIAMTNLTRATQLSLATTLIIGSSAIYADHGQRNNDVESLLLNVASAFLVTEAAQYSMLDREQRSRHSRGYRRDRDNSAHSLCGRHSNRDCYSGASFTSEPVRGGSSRRTRTVETRIKIKRQPALASSESVTMLLI